jgi:hypothetical protein
MAPFEVEKKWSVEELFYPTPVGVHTPWLHMPRRNMTSLIKYCPDIRLIIPKGYLLAYDDSEPWTR